MGEHGGWLVDLDEGHGGHKNGVIKKLISEAVGQGDWGIPGKKFDDQWWIGATCHGRHSEHNWGNWTWDHNGEEVGWYDWMDDEPNDWHSQDCLTYLKDQDILVMVFTTGMTGHVIMWQDISVRW